MKSRKIYDFMVHDFRGDLSVSDSVQKCVATQLKDGKDLGRAYSYCRAAQDFLKMDAEVYMIITDMIVYDAAAMGLPVPNAPGAVGGQNVRPMRTIAEAMRAAGGASGKTTSSNVAKVGYFNSMLEVEFKDKRRYVYFVGPDFYDEFVNSQSKGKFVWEKLRGKAPGLVFDDPSKITPGGVPYSGGKGSIVPYSKGTGGTPEPSTLRPSEPSIPDARERELLHKELQAAFMGEGLRYTRPPPPPRADMTMGGFITRSGEFDYEAEGVKIKKWDNLKEIFNETAHFPVFGKKSYGAHGESYETLIGYTHDWEFFEPGVIDKDGHIYAKSELFEDISDLSDLENPSELPVSIGFMDLGEDGYQDISQLRHLAVSLNKLEGDRCSSMGGIGCNISTINGKERDTYDLYTKTIKNYNMEKKKMGDNKEQEDIMELGKNEKAKEKYINDCVLTGHSAEACGKAYDATEGTGGIPEKKAPQDPAKGDMIEIAPEEYADLLATARVWKENKAFMDGLKKEEDMRKQKEATDLTEDLIKHVEEDFVKTYGKSLCDLKLIKGVVNNLKKPEVDDFSVQKVNTARLMESLGEAIDDMDKQIEEAKQDALLRFFPKE